MPMDSSDKSCRTAAGENKEKRASDLVETSSPDLGLGSQKTSSDLATLGSHNDAEQHKTVSWKATDIGCETMNDDLDIREDKENGKGLRKNDVGCESVCNGDIYQGKVSNRVTWKFEIGESTAPNGDDFTSFPVTKDKRNDSNNKTTDNEPPKIQRDTDSSNLWQDTHDSPNRKHDVGDSPKHDTKSRTKVTRNPYINFYLELLSSGQFKGLRVTDVAKHAGIQWSNMLAEKKRSYYKRAEDARNFSRNPYMNYYRELIGSDRFKGQRVTEVAKLAGGQWSQMSTESKRPYYKMADRAARGPPNKIKRTRVRAVERRYEKEVIMTDSKGKKLEERSKTESKSKSKIRRSREESSDERSEVSKPIRNRLPKAKRKTRSTEEPSDERSESSQPIQNRLPKAKRRGTSSKHEEPSDERNESSKPIRNRSPNGKRRNVSKKEPSDVDSEICGQRKRYKSKEDRRETGKSSDIESELQRIKNKASGEKKRQTLSSSPEKTDSTPVKRKTDSTPVKRKTDSTPVKRKTDSTPVKRKKSKSKHDETNTPQKRLRKAA